MSDAALEPPARGLRPWEQAVAILGQRMREKDALTRLHEDDRARASEQASQTRVCMLSWDYQYSIITEAEPKLFWAPVSHNDETRAQLEASQGVVQKKLRSLKDDINTDRVLTVGGNPRKTPEQRKESNRRGKKKRKLPPK